MVNSKAVCTIARGPYDPDDYDSSIESDFDIWAGETAENTAEYSLLPPALSNGKLQTGMSQSISGSVEFRPWMSIRVPCFILRRILRITNLQLLQRIPHGPMCPSFRSYLSLGSWIALSVGWAFVEYSCHIDA
jgi:hypothetical protein